MNKEKIFFIVLFIIYATATTAKPVFPFMRVSLFSDSPLNWIDFRIRTASGETRENAHYGLQYEYDGDPTMQMGRRHFTLNQWQHPPTADEIRDLWDLMANQNRIPREALCVERRIWGTSPTGKFQILGQNSFSWQSTSRTPCP